MRLPLPSPWDDARLRKRLHLHDRAAFETVVQTHYESIYRQLWHVCGEAETAADLTQETFLEAWRSLAAFQGRSSLRTWLHTLAVRVWYRSRRRLAARPPETALAEAILAAVADSTECPAESAEQAETRAILYTAVAQLPPPYRDAILLFYTEECKYREIAESENIPIGTVKSRLNAALRRLRSLLSAHEKELL